MNPPTLILASGGLRSLVATAIVASAPDAGRLILLHLRDGKPNAPARLDHVRRQAAHFAVFEIIELELPHLHRKRQPAGPEAVQPLVRPQLLMVGLSHAVELGAGRMIVPWHFNADANAVARAAEEIELTKAIAQLEHEKLPGVEAPLLEMTDRQMIEVGGQLDAPWNLAWTCVVHDDKPCRMCAPCKRRHAAFEAAGIVDPVEPLVPVGKLN